MKGSVAICLIAFSFLMCVSCVAPASQTIPSIVLEERANGTAAVLLAVNTIQQSRIFASDNEILRRIAFVETRDGRDPSTFRDGYNGGIWAVDEDTFMSTKNMNLFRRLPAKLRQIEQELGINWLSVEWVELRKPLHSALAARLVIFNAPRPVPPANDLTAQAQFWIEFYNQEGDAASFVTTSTGLEGSILENSANEFFVGFTHNLDSPTLHLFVTTAEPVPVSFSVTATGFSFTGIATSNSSTTVNLPISLEVRTTDERSKGIRVKAEGERKIVVYGLTYAMFTTDAFLALPCSRLSVDEYEYYAVSYPGTENSDILIVGCENDTVITTPSTTVTLQTQETYLIGSSTDTTGWRVASTKPIAFFSNKVCANIPIGIGACDHLTEQVPPTATWGSSFFVASLLGRSSGELIRIVAAKNSTTVSVNCTTFAQVETHTLAVAGSWQEFRINPLSFCFMESSQPILTVQFALGNDLDSVGDPFMSMIPPVEQYSNNYVLNVLPEFSTNYITLYVSAEYYQPSRISVDNITQENSIWTAVYCSNSILCGYITRVELTPGEHRVFHRDFNARLGVSSYGFNEFNSYGYPGGLRLTPVQLATISFEAASYSVSEGDGSITINITRSGDTALFATVLVSTDNFVGTASVKEDYSSLSRIVEFLPEETLQQITISINNDKRIERNETVELYLSAGDGVHLSPFPRAVITIINDDGAINLEPSYGSVLGGADVVVTGDDVSVSEEDEITCTFDGIRVVGVYVNDVKILCISPMLERTGRVNFRLTVIGNNIFSGESTFTSLSYMKSYDVYVGNEDLVFSEDTMIDVQWSPLSIFPMELPDTYNVDLDLLEMNMDTGRWTKLVSLATNVPNSGSASVRMPRVAETETVEDSISPVIVRVSVSNQTLEQASRKRNVFSSLFRRIGRFGLKIIRNAPIRFLKKLGRQLIQRGLCELWGALEPPNRGQEILERLPPCPRSIGDIQAPNSGFTEERLSSLSPVIGDIQRGVGNLDLPIIGRVGDHIGYTIIDDLFREYFHPDTTNCFRQRVTNPELTGGSGQQCCYNGNNLVTGPPGGGTVDLVSPDVSFIRHFAVDVIPYLLCCKAGIFSNCQEYYNHRPSHRGIPFDPPRPPAIFRGDPHIITLDGHQYTFNGNGEFVLIDTPDDSFSLQARMVPIDNTTGNSSQATVFKAIVGQENGSDAVQFEVIEDSTIVLVNGEQIDFGIIKEQEFNNVIVNDLGNRSFSASFFSGAYLEVTEQNGFFSSLIVSLPSSFQRNGTQGLMGSFNDNKTDDLLPNFGQNPLPLNSSTQEIHEQFGITWIIDTPSDSLFTYQPGESWATYHDPFFVPIFEAVFSDTELERQANALCGSDQQCLFDVAATGLVELGQSTLVVGQEFEEILLIQIPVICTTPCEFGVCVANDTCFCSAGYEGEYCNEPVSFECDENPCQNGGTCSRHVLDYSCTCPSTHTGYACETELDGMDDEAGGLSSGEIVGIVVGSLVGAVVLCVVVTAVVVVNKMTTTRSYVV